MTRAPVADLLEGAAEGADVVIVGAGSAGSVLAERLSADPGRRVWVLESGPGPDDPAVRALTADATALPIGADSPVVRHYRTLLTDQPPRPADIVRGECVGGSGAVNGGYFCRALQADLGWAPGWSWTDVEQHYRAVESRVGIRRVAVPGGPTAAFVAAAREAGYRWLPDLNADEVTANGPPGVGAVPLNIVDGTRSGPGAAFLVPASHRPNLTVHAGTRVTRVHVAGGRAVGVDAVGPDGPVRLHADRVVLCAGALGSAHLLMLSGIGPVAVLRACGVDPVADLPVGCGVWDHPEWLLDTGWDGLADHPVLEAVLVSDGVEIRPFTRGFGAGRPQIGVALMRPRSRGRVSLASADPSVPPRIEHRYDSDPADAAALAEGCAGLADMLSGVAELGEPVWSTSQHLCGSAPMGPDDDERSVVDEQCRVRGIEGLWVIDGSVLPTPLARGPHATIAMLAHRAAEFV